MSGDSAIASLSIGIDQALTAQGAAGGYVGRIIDVTPGRAPDEQVREDIVIPLGRDQALTVEMKPGEYIVEAVSPSGELLHRQVSLEGGEKIVRLGQRGRLGSELGWQVVSGNIDRMRVAAETAANEGVRQAERSVAQVRSFWRRLGWARPLLVALAVAAVAGALVLRSGGERGSPPIANTIAATPDQAATAPQNAVEAMAENAIAPLEMGAAPGNMMSAEPEEAAENMTAANGDAPVPRLRRRSIARSAESTETNATATAEMLPSPPPPAMDEPAEANATAAAPAPPAPDVEAKARAPEAEPVELQELPIFWPAMLIVAAILAIGFIFTRWARPRETEGEADDVSAAAAEATATAPIPATAPSAFPATLFRAAPGAAAWAVVDAAEQGISAVRALLEPLAAKAELPGRDCEAFRVHDVAPGQLVAGSEADGPLFALVPAAGSAGEIIAVPLPWTLQKGGEAGFEIASSTSPSSSFSASSTIKDSEAATILGYMAAGRLQQAELIVRSAEEMLNFKYRNPLAATLGAYVLISSCVNRGGGAAWRPWIGNLYADFPWLPDASILQGWNLLQQQQGQADVDRARECLMEAVERGLPIFSEGVRLLQSGLAMFGGKGAEKRLTDAIERVDKLALRCAPAQAFTTIRVSADP